MEEKMVVTGASTGIGWAVAEAFGRNGWQVLAGARKPQDLDRLGKLPGVEPIALDVTKDEDCRQLADRFRGQALTALVNNAGVAIGGPWEILPMEDIRHQFEVNVFGLLNVTKALLPAIRKGHGRIVNISSISGRVAGGCLGPYASSKFAVEAITDSMRRELSGFGVKVISINPGPIATKIWGKIPEREQIEALLTDPELRTAYSGQIDAFLGRIDKATTSAEPVEKVVKVIEESLLAKRPKSRYYVGKGIWFAAQLTKLPDSVLDKIVQNQS